MGVPASCAFAAIGDGFIFFPEHGDEGHAGLNEAARHHEAGGVHGLAVPLEGVRSLAFDVEGTGGTAGGEELESALLLTRVVTDGLVMIELAAHF